MGKDILIAASMACANFKNLEKTIELLEMAKVDILHFDICDGSFAPTFLLSPIILKSLRPLTNLRFDVHLYCEYPAKYLDEFIECGADLIVVHVESKDDYQICIKKIKEKGIKAGIGILPNSKIPENLFNVLDDISLIIANTVGPAFQGQPFNVKGLRNIQQLNDIKLLKKLKFDIGADGGVNFTTINELIRAGANLLMCGSSSIFVNEYDIISNVSKLKNQIRLMKQ